MANQKFKMFMENRTASRISELIRLFNEGKLTAESANGIAGALAEIRYLERETEERVDREREKNKIVKNDPEMVEDQDDF